MLFEIDVKNNGLVILENVPAGTDVGIDYHVWTSGPHFRGIANIPPGFHFIFFAFTDKYGEKSPRSGFYVHLKAGEVVRKVYDEQNEEMKDVDGFQNQSDLEEIGKYLAPYPLEHCSKWPTLTDRISPQLVCRVQPVCRKIDFLTTVHMEEQASKHMNSVLNVDSRIENSTDENAVIRFTRLPLKLPEGLTPQEVTKHSMDSSYMLEKLIGSMEGGEEDLIGELQFAFVTFLIGQVYDCFEHWKLLVSLLTKSQDTLLKRNGLYTRFVDTVRLQMEEIPQDYFADITAQHNFLVHTFQRFFDNFADPSGMSGELVKKVSLLKHHLLHLFECDFEEENEEDMPVVVEL